MSQSTTTPRRGPGRPRKVLSVQASVPESSVQEAAELYALIRLSEIVGDPARGVKPLLPIGKSTWWDGVRAGHFPQPVRLPGCKATFWRKADVLALLAGAGGESA
jgi:predicted DNA-binding transcriptional regulator AlpA